jgi:hypothetical protein
MSGGVVTNSPVVFAQGGVGSVAVYAPSLTSGDSPTDGKFALLTNGVTQGEWLIYGGGGGGGGGGGAYPRPIMSWAQTASPTNWLMNGTRGWPEASYCVMSSTNLTDWLPLTTNALDVYGCCSNTIPIDPLAPQQFYRLMMLSP